MNGRLKIVPGDVWMDQAEDEPPAIIDRFLPAKSLAFIAAEPGVGKSWMLWELALSVANGKPFMGKFPIATSGPVLVIASEGSRKASAGRAWALANGKGMDPARAMRQVHVSWRDGFSLLDPGNVADVVAYVREHGIGLVFADTLHGATPGLDENSSGAWGDVMKRGLHPIMAAGATVALVHHTSKANESTRGRRAGQNMRGSSALHGSRDCLLSLSRDRDDPHSVRVDVELRDDAPIRPFTFRTPERHVGIGDMLRLEWAPADDAPAPPVKVDRRARALEVVAASPGTLTRSAVVGIVKGRKEDTLAIIDGLIETGELVKTEPGSKLWVAVDDPTRNPHGNVPGTDMGPNETLKPPALAGGGFGDSEVY